MSLLQIVYFILTIYIQTCKSATLDKTIQPTGEIWLTQNGNDLDPTGPAGATSYGTINLGQIMSIEFDFDFHGRSNDPRTGYQENFFRIGFDTCCSEGCDGEGSAFPAMFLARSGEGDYLDIQVSSGSTCGYNHYLNDYTLSTTQTHHIKISFNNTQVVVDITGGGQPTYNKQWTRLQTPKDYLGDAVNVYFLSPTVWTPPPHNRGWATFNNIIIKSNIFTFAPTAAPSITPTTSSPTTSLPTTTYPTTQIPSISPSYNPSISPSKYPSNNPTTTSPTQYPPTTSPTNNPTISTYSPTNNPSISPSKYPTRIPTTMQPTTNNPTISPITSSPSISPTIYTINPTISPSDISISPSISPIISPTRSEIKVNDDTTEMPNNNNGNSDGKTGNNNKSILDGTTLGIIIAVSVVSVCMICGIIILYKQRKKKKEQNKTNTDSDYYRAQQQHIGKQIELGINEINVNSNYNYNNNNGENNQGASSPYTPEGVMKNQITGFNNDNNSQEQYLSDAQKQLVYNTPGGPDDNMNDNNINDNNNINMDDDNGEHYLSAAQKQELNVTKMGLEEYDASGNKINEDIGLEVEEHYLSEAQKKEILVTADGGNINDSIYDKPDDYLSEAQRKEMRNNPNLQNENDIETGGKQLTNIMVNNDEFIIKNSDTDHTSDDDIVLDNIDTPGGLHGNNNVKFIYKNSSPVHEGNHKNVTNTSDNGIDNIQNNMNSDDNDDNDEEIEKNITIGAISISENIDENDIVYDENITIGAINQDDDQQHDDNEYDIVYDENIDENDDDEDNFETIQ